MTTDTSTTIGSMWPAELPPYVKAGYNDQPMHQSREFVPSSLEELDEWCYLATDQSESDRARNKYLAYRGTTTEDVQEIAFRFQGVVRSVALDKYGTWNGYVAQLWHDRGQRG